MGLKLITAPSVEPITLEEARQHLRVTSTSEDALILALVTTARLHAEEISERAFVTQTWDYSLDAFPAGIFELPKAPLQSVTSVTYLDTDGASQTLDSSLYKVDAVSDPGRIAPAYGEVWPSTRDEPNAVTVRFVAGYGLAAAVPRPLKQAMLLILGHLYMNREDTVEGNVYALPAGSRALLSTYRVFR